MVELSKDRVLTFSALTGLGCQARRLRMLALWTVLKQECKRYLSVALRSKCHLQLPKPTSARGTPSTPPPPTLAASHHRIFMRRGPL